MSEAVQCRGRVEGPKMKGMGGAVQWRRQCRRMTRHESGCCPDHRATWNRDQRRKAAQS